MPKTRKPRHTRRHTKRPRHGRRRSTHRVGGMWWSRSSSKHDLRGFTQTLDLTNYNWTENHDMSSDERDHAQYLDFFINCKRSKMFTRFTRRGNCAHLRGEDYRISHSLKVNLLEEISRRVDTFIEKAFSKNKTSNPTIMDHISSALFKRKYSIINKAIKDFYVITYDNLEQSFVDIKANNGIIPKSTKSAFVFPAGYYLLDTDRTHLGNVYDLAVNNITSQQEDQDLNITDAERRNLQYRQGFLNENVVPTEYIDLTE